MGKYYVALVIQAVAFLYGAMLKGWIEQDGVMVNHNPGAEWLSLLFISIPFTIYLMQKEHAKTEGSMTKKYSNGKGK